MAYTFPLQFADFANRLPVASFSWELQRFEEFSGTARGETIVNEIAAPKWRADVSLRPMLITQANEIQALMEVLGSSNRFGLYDLRKCGPASDPDGSILGSATPTVYAIGTDGKTLRLQGLPAGYTLAIGDMLAIKYGAEARVALHRVVSPAAASGVGITGFFEIRPHMKVGPGIGNVVALRKPWAEMQVTSYSVGDRHGRFVDGVGFTALEAY